MSVDSQQIRSESHLEIGNLLQWSVDPVLERWTQQAAAEQPNAKRVHHAVLLNQLRELLQSIGRSLIETEERHTNQHCLRASHHGEQRWETGWSLVEVIRDYQILRVVIMDFLEERLERPLGYREVLAIGLALDEAIAASMVTYVNSRDAAMQEAQEKNAEESRKTQERLREQAEELQQADRRKNEFLATLSHELRNPLAPVRNALQVLKLKGPSDPDMQWAREVIERQVQQMAGMVDDLLDVSRIARGKVKLDKLPVELSTIVARATETAQPLIDARKHRLTVTLPPEPVWLEADAPRLVQVVANLLTNAAKYTDVGGKIWLVAETQNEEVIVRVRDTGIGIPADLLPRVFTPFTQEERFPDRAQGGLGIGLALVRSLVDLHGGRVQALSAGRDLGSEFVIHLPASKGGSPQPVVKPASENSSNGPARRILVVDDNKDAAASLGMLLKLLGHDVRIANDGPGALELAAASPPEVVLLDIGLPRMDGLEVARRLRNDLGLKDALLVALTGYGQDEDRRRSQEAGFNAHLVKPVDLDELPKLLARAPIRD